MSLNWIGIAENVMAAVIGGGIVWLFSRTLKNSKDCNAAFRKIRNIETFLRELSHDRTTDISIGDSSKDSPRVPNGRQQSTESAKLRQEKDRQAGKRIKN